MGGYGAFVWSAYAITFVVLAANLIITNMNHKRLIAKLQRERALDAAIAAGGSNQPGDNT